MKHLAFAFRYHPLLMIGGTILLWIAITGLNQDPIPSSSHLNSGVSMFGDVIYYLGVIGAAAMIIYAWNDSVPLSQQVKRVDKADLTLVDK